MSEFIDPIAAFQNGWIKKRHEELQFHLHPDGRDGASTLGTCNLIGGLKKAKIPLPQKTGLKAETGGMDVGNEWHDIIKQMLREYYTSEEWTSENPDIIYGEEIYEESEVIDGQTILSPIDIAFATEPGFILKEVEFANIIAELPFKHPDAQWIKILDLKSASDLFAFWKYKKEGPNYGYKAQMHFYMEATGLDEIEMIFVNKANGKMFPIIVKFEKAFWEVVLESLARKSEIADIIKKWFVDITEESTFGDIPSIQKSDLSYFTQEDIIECRYCHLSECHEEYEDDNPENKGRLVMDKPCLPACNFIREEANAKFKTGGLFTRGKSHITITNIVGDYIYSKNKGGTEYIDSIFTAMNSFKERV